ncbi:P-loop containing nucleoside triphosphate hydrolase protein [Hypoxylon sp. NC1633]|nr:P-loop containing nucleoside triphosphate hydrolase protein [Hypoxylon sp. NC1633]
MDTNMLPIISVIGANASGKTTLSWKLAEEFDLYLLDIEELLRSMVELPLANKALRHLEDYIRYNELIPEELVEQLGSPDEALIHNSYVRKKRVPIDIALPVLQRKCAQISKEGNHRGILFDGFPRVAGQPKAALEFFDEESYLAIFVHCPEEVARSRSLSYPIGDDDPVFEFKLAFHRENLPQLVQMLEAGGLLVKTLNDGSVTIDEAYASLVAILSENKIWNELIVSKSR